MFAGSNELYTEGQILWVLKFTPSEWSTDERLKRKFFLQTFRSPRRWANAVKKLKENGEIVHGGAISMNQLVDQLNNSILKEITNVEEALRLHRSPTEHS